jgi:hypothetical protein
MLIKVEKTDNYTVFYIADYVRNILNLQFSGLSEDKKPLVKYL